MRVWISSQFGCTSVTIVLYKVPFHENKFAGVSRWISGTSGQADNCNKLGGAIGVVAEQLWHAMQSTDADSAKVIVEQLGVS